MEQLGRPILISDASGAETRLVERLWAALDHLSGPLRIMRVHHPETGDDVGGFETIRDELYNELTSLIEHSTLGLEGVHWIVMVDLAEQSTSAQDLLFKGIVPMAERMNHDGHQCLLTIVLIDHSSSMVSAAAKLFKALASTVADAGIHLSTQVHVIRRRLGDTGLLSHDALIESAVLTCRALTLLSLAQRNVPESFPELRGPRQVLVGTEPSRIFGRVSIRSLRSLQHQRARECSTVALQRFTEDEGAVSGRVRTGWDVPMISIARPEVSADPNLRIGSGFRGGAPMPFTGPPSLRANPQREVHRLEREAERWAEQLVKWRRDTRLGFTTSVRELRDAAGEERRRVAEDIDMHAKALWTQPEIDRPFPYTREWLARQKARWLDERSHYATKSLDLRATSSAQAVATLQPDFLRLRAEMAQRPNSWLMGLFTLAAILGGTFITWELLSNVITLAGRVTWLEINLADQLRALRIPLLIGLILIILTVPAASLFGTRIRWDRAYTTLRARAQRTKQEEESALEREFNLIDEHWHLKTLSASVRRLRRVEDRLNTVARQLEEIPPPETPHSVPILVRYLPDPDAATSASSPFPCHSVSQREINRLLRDDEMADQWLHHDPTNWLGRARQRIEDRYEASWKQSAVEVDQALDHELSIWERSASHQLISGSAQDIDIPEQYQAFFVTGEMGIRSAHLLHQRGITNVLAYESERDEVLCCAVQMGLTPEAASQ